MLDTSFLPVLSAADVEQAAQLIRQAQSPSTAQTTPDDLRRLQQELYDMQKRTEAWGLVVPFLESEDPTVQFFGAHTAQVKIARDWDSFPSEHAERLKDLLVQVTCISIVSGRGKFIVRKLFVALTSLALKLVPHPTRWPSWILSCVTQLSNASVSTEFIHNFLAICAEEVLSADLIGAARGQMNASLHEAVPMVSASIKQVVDRPSNNRASPSELEAALLCFQAWLSLTPANDLTDIVPALISLLQPTSEDDEVFVGASDAFQELLQRSTFSDGSGTRAITEPLLLWLDDIGSQIITAGIDSGNAGSSVSRAICKLLTAIGDHSTMYIANNLASSILVNSPSPYSNGTVSELSTASSSTPKSPRSKGYLVQNFLRLLLVYTGLPGYYGIDEEESEMTLGFWYLLQEALWTTDYYFPEDENEEKERRALQLSEESEELKIAKAVYIELVKILRRKAALPPPGSGWSKDQFNTFDVYRRDIGDTLINAYYVLRDDMLAFYVEDVLTRLTSRQSHEGWEEIESTLHCLMCIQEALEADTANPYLARLFSPQVLEKLPTSGHSRVRRTMVNTIGTYANWFASQPTAGPGTYSVLMNAVGYVVEALAEPSLCLSAANALKKLCDFNRKALAPQLGAFAQLHAGIERIPDTEKPKVLQSIASVIQALPPEEQISPVEAIVNPLCLKMAESLQSAVNNPEEARAATILQLEALTGVAKGLTRTSDPMNVLDDNDTVKVEVENIRRIRQDPRTEKMRNDIFLGIQRCFELWSVDSSLANSLIDLIKAITSLPTDITILSLPPGPLMALICGALQRQVTASWLSIASMVIAQLNPPTFSMTEKTGPSPEAQDVLNKALPIILQLSLTFLGQPGSMEANPDIVQDFMSCMNRVAQDFPHSFFELPPGALDALMNCAISCLSLQERYSLTNACNFLSTLIHRSSVHDDLVPKRDLLLQTHGYPLTKAILNGVAGGTPPSVLPNLIEMTLTLTSRALGEVRKWVPGVLFAEDFPQTKATNEDKHRLSKAIASGKHTRRIRDAMSQFSVIARGLNNSNFGISSISAM